MSNYSFSTSEEHDLPRAVSADRFGTYLRETGGDRQRALALYEWNMAVSAAFWTPLHLCEVVVRNGIVDAIEAVHTSAWPVTRGFLASLPDPIRGYNPRKEVTAKGQRHPTTGKVVADLTLAFWEQMLTKRHDDRIWNGHFRACFPNASGLSVAGDRKDMHNDVFAIRKLRNRIAHFEPVFARNLADDLERLVRLTSRRSRTAATYIERIETVTPLLSVRP